MRKIPDAYTLTFGILLLHMRHHAENHHFYHTVLWPDYMLPCAKSPAHTRQLAVFHITGHTALYYCCKALIRYRAE